MSKINFEGIPSDLKQEERWLLWRLEEPTGRKKPTKVPYCVRDPRRRASSTDPSTWAPFEHARRVFESEKCDGIGFALGGGFAGVDLDACVNPQSLVIEQWACDVLARLNSYAEYSPSRTGVHLIVRGSLPNGRRRNGRIEIYDGSRYFTVTGNRVSESPTTVLDRGDQLEQVWASFVEHRSTDVGGDKRHDPSAPSDVTAQSDEIILQRICRSVNGSTFEQLRTGHWTAAYRSHSEADLAFCAIVARFGADPQQIDRLFRNSGLMRDKWDERRGADTYGAMTIAKATEQPDHMADDPDPIDLTDIGNARRLAMGNPNLKFDQDQNTWLIFNGQHWSRDCGVEVERFAQAVVEDRFCEATKTPNAMRRRKLTQFATQSASRERLAAMISLARSEKALSTRCADWNQDPHLLGAPNGVIDLRTGEFRNGTVNDRITRVVATVFDPSAAAPRWTRFLNEVFEQGGALIAYVQRALGYSLTGLTSEQVLFLNVGAGANGKSTLLNAIRGVMNEYACHLPFATLEARRGSIPDDLAMLPGVRFATLSEPQRDARLNEAVVKTLTGGDPITARRLYGQFFTFTPQAKFWIATNELPLVRDHSHAFWRRIHTIRYRKRFSGDARLSEQLRSERSGILNWLVAGAVAYFNRGLDAPGSIHNDTATFRAESDLVRRFIDDECELGPELQSRSSELYTAFNRWCNSHGIPEGSFDRLSHKAFAMRIPEWGEWGHDRRGSYYRGIALRTGHECASALPEAS